MNNEKAMKMNLGFEHLVVVNENLKSSFSEMVKMAKSPKKADLTHLKLLVEKVLSDLSLLSSINAHGLYTSAIEDIGRIHNEFSFSSAPKQTMPRHDHLAVMEICSMLPITSIEHIGFYAALDDLPLMKCIDSYFISGDLLKGRRGSFSINSVAGCALALGRNDKQEAFAYFLTKLDNALPHIEDNEKNQKQLLSISRFVGGYFSKEQPRKPKELTVQTIAEISAKLLPFIGREHYAGFTHRFYDGISAARFGLKDLGEEIVGSDIAFDQNNNPFKLLELKSVNSIHFHHHIKRIVSSLKVKKDSTSNRALIALFIFGADDSVKLSDLAIESKDAHAFADDFCEVFVKDDFPTHCECYASPDMVRTTSLIDALIEADPEVIEALQKCQQLIPALRISPSTKKAQLLKEMVV